MATPFSADDLGRIFHPRTLTRGRSLVLIGAVEVAVDNAEITGAVEEGAKHHNTAITVGALGRRPVFDSRCSCQTPGCVHLAATLLAALDRFPALRVVEPESLFAAVPAGPTPERRRLQFDLAPADPPHACTLLAQMVGEASGRAEAITPRRILATATSGDAARAMARMMGGENSRADISPAALPELMRLLLSSGQGRWATSGKKLTAGPERVFDADSPPKLPSGSAVLLGSGGPWYVDATTGIVGKVRLRRRVADAPPAFKAPPRRVETTFRVPDVTDPVFVEMPITPVLRMDRINCPDAFGRPVMIDALTIEFDYGGHLLAPDDTRQFVRINGKAGPLFVRRDPALEAAAQEALRNDGFIQMRIADTTNARGRRVLVLHGDNAAERWHHFIAARAPALAAEGWRTVIDSKAGPRPAGTAGHFDVRIADAPDGFSLDFGIEVEGVRLPLLPILSRLLERGGMDAAQVVGDEIITSLEDGRVVKLPAERIRRLLAIMGDLIEAAGRIPEGPLVLPTAEAATVVELEDVVATDWAQAAIAQMAVARFRDAPAIPPAVLPSTFKGILRPYQQHGFEWMQHLRTHNLGAFLADDMGLGKTAQTIAHLVAEHASGRMDRPSLIVVPTSLISNWTAELRTFAPHLRTVVLHGMDRHERRGRLDGIQVAITTYTVLARDIAEMETLPWHIVVLDEAQAIKSPSAKATIAVCRLDARQRVCLSGTPIENNLEELWSQFAFLQPGLLGTRQAFARRFRTPIEKNNDGQRRGQLVRRIRPFILRRTKAEVATELPPKHTILRRITLAPDQRELYEAIRVTLHEKVRAQVAERSLAQSRIIVLDALLKLRQACCDPRLVKLPSARGVEGSSKLDDLMEMLTEMVPEGRKVLLFSQFTSMLDLIKPRLEKEGIPFVELRGDTRDRAEPVRAFQAGEVPLFLISLKAGGRGLNLTAADTVIHYDPWWNPAVENQASDRAHRIGQTKPVFVYKLIGADTVEERILELQQRKADLAEVAFSEGGELAGLAEDDVDFLFGVEADRKAA